MTPAGLHKTATRIRRQKGDGIAQEIRRRDKIGIENRRVLSPRHSQTGGEGPRLKTLPIGAMQMFDVVTSGLQLVDQLGYKEPEYKKPAVQ